MKELVYVVSKFGKVPTHAVGDIRISKTRTFVDIPEKFVKQVLKGNGSYKVGRHKFSFAVDA